MADKDKDKDKDTTQDDKTSQQQPQDTSETPETWDAYLEQQSDEVKKLHADHTAGLKSALDSERESRKDAEKQLRAAAEKAEKGSEAQKELEKMADQMAEADRKAEFYEAAHAAGVSNIGLAYIAAVKDEMFDKRGNVNFETMKTAYPELFGGTPTASAGNAGAGTQTPPPGGPDMNERIRKAAGR